MKREYEYIVNLALKEDIGDGDITTQAIYRGDEIAEAELIAKQDGVIAGLELIEYTYQQLSDNINFETETHDGARIKRGQLIAVARGPANILLTGERTVLNFLQRMSGVATLTNQFVEEIKHTGTKILDTRKTMPGHRYLDKWAVRLGGGSNHRERLDDLFLIKDNHISVAGGIAKAIQACVRFRKQNNLDVKIEIEVANLDALDEILDQGEVDIIMLDNMSLTDMQKAVKKTGARYKLEASGNVHMANVADIAETGVDYISVGAITHSATALDISMLFVE